MNFIKKITTKDLVPMICILAILSSFPALADVPQLVKSSTSIQELSNPEYLLAESHFLSSIVSPTVRAQTFEPGYGEDSHRNLDQLFEAHLKAIYAYTLGDYVKINRILRSDTSEDDLENNPNLKAEILVMRQALKQIRDFAGTVYRGADLPAELLAAHIVGQVVTYTGFSSASKKREVAQGFALGQLLIIHAKHGKVIQPYSQQPREDEVLFDHHSKFKVLSRETNYDNVYNRSIEVITLDEIAQSYYKGTL